MSKWLRAPVNPRKVGIVVLGMLLLVGRAMAQVSVVGSFSGGTIAVPITGSDGSTSAPAYSYSSSSNSGIYNASAGATGVVIGGTERARFTSSGLSLGANALQFGSTLTSLDAGLSRVTGKVMSANDGGGGGGWLQETAGHGALNADYTNATTTFSNTNLSISVIIGRTYAFTVVLIMNDSTAAEGMKIDFNGGGAAATNFIANCVLTNEVAGTAGGLAAATTSALATVINATTMTTTGNQLLVCEGSFVPSSSGTFIVRAAQNSHASGTLTIKRGSWIQMFDVPAL